VGEAGLAAVSAGGEPLSPQAAVTAGEPGTGAQAGYGSAGTSGEYGWLPSVLLPGT
jgi:hypothetical protein